MKTHSLLFALLLAAGAAQAAEPGFLPGRRVLLDAHNCYPYEGAWSNRLERALACGLPIGIEEDLVWDPGAKRVVVRHGGKATAKDPALRDYFFEPVRPIMEKALREGDRKQWPLVTLNLNDLRASDPEFFAALWELLGSYESWLCTAPKQADPARVAPLEIKPLLVLTSDGTEQAKAFYDHLPVGGRLRLFAAGRPDRDADNFRRWLNFSWRDVEPEGQARAGDWTAEDAARLKALVEDAHRRGYWIRFYTLNGHPAADGPGEGWNPSYNFGSAEAAAVRWKAAQAAGVDFIASDQFEACARALRRP